MAFHSLFVFVLLINIAFGGSHSTMTKEELYWKSVFPHTPMPKVLQQILPTPGLISDKGVVPNSLGTDFLDFDHYALFGYSEEQVNGGPGTDFFDFDHYGVFESYSEKQVNGDPGTDSIFDHYGVFESYSDKEPKAERHIDPTQKVNRKALGGKSIHRDTDTKETFFFVPRNLVPGTKMNLPILLQKSNMATFLPQQIANSILLSNENLPQILKNLSLNAESKGAYDVKVTVNKCERSEMKGETKYCATSLESFVDSSVLVLGNHIQLLSLELGKDTKDPLFTIGKGIEKMGENNIICHKMKYPYAVYLCHSIERTETYKVPLVSEDGKKTKAIAVCHKDTSVWSPNHIAFKLLKVKPGTVPICHFIGRDTLVWISY